jgi:hypothetical protein
MAGGRPPQGNLLQVVVPPRHGDSWRFHIALSQKEFGVIGLVVVQWAFLEFALYERTKRIAKRARYPIPRNATVNSFSKRLGAFREVIENAITNKARKNKLLSLCSRIAQASGNRQKVAHGLWLLNPQKPDRLWVKNQRRKAPGAARKRKQVLYQPFTTPRLGKISEEIGALSFELWYDRGPRDVIFSQSYLSRSFLLATRANNHG